MVNEKYTESHLFESINSLTGKDDSNLLSKRDVSVIRDLLVDYIINAKSESDLIHLLKSLSAILQPDYGTVFTNESMNLLIDEDRRARLFGGIFFLSNSIIPQSDDLKKFTLADKNRFGNIYSLAGWCASPNDHNSILLISNLDKSLKL